MIMPEIHLYTIDYHDRPVSYICKREGQLYFVVLVEETDQYEKWFYSPITDREYTRVINEEISPRMLVLRPGRFAWDEWFRDNYLLRTTPCQPRLPEEVRVLDPREIRNEWIPEP